jgi:hypothetical protein
MFQLLKLFEFPDVIRFSPEATGKKLEIKVSRGSKKRVLEIAYPGHAAEKVLLLDSEAPLPERLEYKRNKHFAYEFRDFLDFSGHQFPRNLIQLDSDKPKLEVKVQELTESTVDPSSLIPAPIAITVRECIRCRTPRELRYPSPKRSQGESAWMATVFTSSRSSSSF